MHKRTRVYIATHREILRLNSAYIKGSLGLLTAHTHKHSRDSHPNLNNNNHMHMYMYTYICITHTRAQIKLHMIQTH